MPDFIPHINLTKEAISPETLNYIYDQTIYVYPLKLTATSNINFEDEEHSDPTGETEYPANLFVLQKSGTAFDPNQGDMFVKTSSVIDIYELPTEDNFETMNANSNTEQTPYYRVNTVELACRDAEHATDLFEKIKGELKVFLKNYNLKNSEETQSETIIIN